MSKLIYVPAECSDLDTFKYILVGEAPGETEEAQRRPFVGKSGQFLRKTLKDLGIQEEEVYFTNVVKVRPEGNRKPTQEEIESWVPILEGEILNVSDHGYKTIIALGKSAEWALKCTDFAVHNIWHPSYVLRFNKQEEWKKVLKLIFKNTD